MYRNIQKVPRKQVDITKLPKWQQYIIVFSVIAAVVFLAVKFGDPNAAPEWVHNYLIPAVVVSGLVFWLFVFARWLRKTFR